MALGLSFLGARLQSFQTHASAAKQSYDERVAQIEKTYGDLLGPAHMPAYTAWFVQTIQLYKNGVPDGEPKTSNRVQARRENRDTMLSDSFDLPNYKNSINTVRISNGDVVEGQGTIKAKSTYHLHRYASLVNDLPIFDPPTDCRTALANYRPMPVYVGGADVAGVHTSMLRFEDSHAGQRTIETSYRAPSLGCLILKQVMEFHDATGNVTQVSGYEANKVVIGEPDPALFDLSSYRELDPKTVHDEWVKFNAWEPAQHPVNGNLQAHIDDYQKFHLTRER